MELIDRAVDAERAASERAQGRGMTTRYALMPITETQERELLNLPLYWQTQSALQNPDGTFRYTVDDTGARLGDGTQRFGIDSFGRFQELP